MEMTYNFTNGANNGRIVSAADAVAGETLGYTYDSLNRLSLAETVGSGGWGQSFTYDGFGNMTAKTRTKGTAGVVPEFSTTIHAATNGGPTSYPHALPDALDVENRPFGGNGATYGYDQGGKRVLNRATGPFAWSGTWEYVVYDLGGRRLKTVTCSYSEVPLGGGATHQSPSCGVSSRNVYFGGRMVISHDKLVAVDRLGSVRANSDGEKFAYYPYGESKAVSGTAIPDGREKFGTYVRDSATQDYADQRYYGVGTGRFNVPDPSKGGSAADPDSWNKYAYTQGDPVNFNDPAGLARCTVHESQYNPRNPDQLQSFITVYCISAGESLSDFGVSTPYYGNEQDVLKEFEATLGARLDRQEWDRTHTALKNGAAFIQKNMTFSPDCQRELGKMPPQQNLWGDSGSGSRPKL